jgi:tRNA(Ile)-lysidine synthase
MGDKIKVKGLNGTKKVKDIFIDKKISLSKRDSWPIVVDSKGNVVWIPGIKKSKFDKKINENYDIILKYN